MKMKERCDEIVRLIDEVLAGMHSDAQDDAGRQSLAVPAGPPVSGRPRLPR